MFARLKIKILIQSPVRPFFASFFSMLSSVVLVDCVIVICCCKNGRGVFLFVVMGCVVWFGGLCGCCHGRLWVYSICFLCISVIFWWCSFVVTILSLVFVFIVGCVVLVITHASLGHGFREFAEGYAQF